MSTTSEQMQTSQTSQTSDRASKWEVVIGLEVHAQLKTQTKLFCRCSTEFGEMANSNVCPVCLGYPGALPVLNKEAVQMAAQVGLALGGRISPMSYFERKNYFYPDLPKAYQISQLAHPISTGGKLVIHLRDHHGEEIGRREVGIERIQLEEDAGKLMHSEQPGVGESYVDLNRTSTPLIEIVSKPDLRGAAEAAEYMRSMRSLLRYLKVSDGNMQEGSLRCDANVSLRLMGSDVLGTRTEIKNMNTFKGVEAAVTYEIKRQAALLESGGKVQQQTLLFDHSAKKTRPMRSKEEAQDYRYFPDPDLLPVWVNEKLLAELQTALPELPEAKRTRFMEEYGLSSYDSSLLIEDGALAAYYEEAVRSVPGAEGSKDSADVDVKGEAKRVANWIITEVLSTLNNELISIHDFKIPAAHIGILVGAIASGKISGKIAKDVFKEMLKTGKAPEEIIKAQGYEVLSDRGELEKLVSETLAAHPHAVEQYRSGKKQSLGFLVGQVMRATRGQADPKLLDALFREKL